MAIQNPDIVIAVMGMTGAGKSSFIRRITRDQSIRVGDTLHSGKHNHFFKESAPKCYPGLTGSTETEEVTSYRYSYGGKTFRLIDTPGFDDSRFADDIIVEKILEWLRNSLAQGTTLNGIIYIHPIIKPRIGGTASSNIRMFKQLCGKDFYRNVVLATTFWEGIDPSEGAKREKELCENDEFWGILKRRGSRVVRLGLDDSKDQRLLLEIAEQEKCILQAQKEMREGKDISDTAAAKEVKEVVTNWSKWFEQQLRLEEQKCSGELDDHFKRSQVQLEAHRQNLEREHRRKRADYTEMKKQWLQRQRERDQRSAALQAEIDQLRQRVDQQKRNAAKMEHPYIKHTKCRRVSVASVMCCSYCGRTIKPKRHRFYRKWQFIWRRCLSFCHFLYLRADESCVSDCCRCHDDDYDHCERCGSECENPYHPEMKLIDHTNDGCVIM
jgi:GTPase SAR1 family protein